MPLIINEPASQTKLVTEERITINWSAEPFTLWADIPEKINISLYDLSSGNFYEMGENIRSKDLKYDIRLSDSIPEGSTYFLILHSASDNTIVGCTKLLGVYNKGNIWGVNTSTGNIYHNDYNVGIGTENPDEKLCVNGTIKAQRVKVTREDWSDFVFNDDYNLRPLDEVEKYIKANKHLPDIPGEKEVLENGFDLGDMNAKLLQKIEELTLYMIELKKDNDSLRKEISNLKK